MADLHGCQNGLAFMKFNISKINGIARYAIEVLMVSPISVPNRHLDRGSKRQDTQPSRLAQWDRLVTGVGASPNARETGCRASNNHLICLMVESL